MNRTSNTVNDGVGIVARLLVLAILLGFLSTVLQGCSSKVESTAIKAVEYQDVILTVGSVFDNGYLVWL